MSSNQEQYKQHILEIIAKVQSWEATDAEIRELDEWYEISATGERYAEGMTTSEKLQAKEKMLQRINSRIYREAVPVRQINPLRHLKKYALAAIILLVAGTGWFFYQRSGNPISNQESTATLIEDFKPGSNKAVLTLAGGKQIILTGAKNGQLATESGTAINKTTDGEIIYNAGESRNATPLYNTMTTPRGGQYHLTLADGTVAWLNAASSITYPVAFAGKQREVEITGEVYFQVAHNAAKPFMVKSGDQTVQVLGTHFNINAYNNEGAIKTTLLEGSVAISSGSKRQVLKPGQQATLKGQNLVVAEADVTEAVAWKDGYFQFIDTDIETIMRQISRWYDVDVVFEGPVTKETFTGRISRFRNISEALKIVQSSNGVHLTYSGRRIMVRQ